MVALICLILQKSVRRQKTTGKFAVDKNEMKRAGLLILGISETYWTIVDEFTSGEENFVFLSGKGGHTGVEIIVDGRYEHLALGVRAINNQMAIVRIDAASSIISIIQA